MVLARKGREWGNTAVGVLAVLVMLFPVFWAVVSSLETPQQIFQVPPYLLPPTPSLAAYDEAFHVLGHYFVNSVIISVGTLLLSLLLAAPAAYALAHLRLRVTVLVVLLLLITQMFPAVMLATPLFLIYNHFGLVNSYLGLILADTMGAMPFVILVLRAYLLGVPFELTEAALVDGTGYLGAFRRVILPVATPGLVTAGLFAFLGAWNEFTFGLTLTTNSNIQPLTLGLYTFVTQHTTDWTGLMAGAVLTSLPAAIILVAAQRFITAGLTSGALKG